MTAPLPRRTFFTTSTRPPAAANESNTKSHPLRLPGPVTSLSTGAAEGSGGKFNVALHLDGQWNRKYTAAAHEGVALDAAQQLAGKDFTLIEGALITGKIVEKATGKPIVSSPNGRS